MENRESMVEKVAKAIGAVATERSGVTRGISPWWHYYVDDARAAIAAMREPTTDMTLRGGAQLITKGEYEPTAADGAYEIWQAMVDAALKEGGV